MRGRLQAQLPVGDEPHDQRGRGGDLGDRREVEDVCPVMGWPGSPAAGSRAEPPWAMAAPAAVRTPAAALAGWLPSRPRASSRPTASLATVTGVSSRAARPGTGCPVALKDVSPVTLKAVFPVTLKAAGQAPRPRQAAVGRGGDTAEDARPGRAGAARHVARQPVRGRPADEREGDGLLDVGRHAELVGGEHLDAGQQLGDAAHHDWVAHAAPGGDQHLNAGLRDRAGHGDRRQLGQRGHEVGQSRACPRPAERLVHVAEVKQLLARALGRRHRVVRLGEQLAEQRRDHRAGRGQGTAGVEGTRRAGRGGDDRIDQGVGGPDVPGHQFDARRAYGHVGDPAQVQRRGADARPRGTARAASGRVPAPAARLRRRPRRPRRARRRAPAAASPRRSQAAPAEGCRGRARR